MVIDSSALVAVLFDEEDRLRIEAAIEADPVRLISAVSKLETSMVLLGRRDREVLSRFDRFLARVSATIVPFDDHQADMARDAFAHYGKGRHPAALNFGDCAAYALSFAEAGPLLFKGTDFGATDVQTVQVA
jgi:ribonuclease VapC